MKQIISCATEEDATTQLLFRESFESCERNQLRTIKISCLFVVNKAWVPQGLEWKYQMCLCFACLLLSDAEETVSGCEDESEWNALDQATTTIISFSSKTDTEMKL